jgi:hypothetical protein
VLEGVTMQAPEALVLQAQDGSGATLLKDAPASVEVVAFDVLLGINSVKADLTG